ncbi:MAG: phosphatidylglycerophosphatase A [Paenibacillus sp. RIFOXYA1_FULL_44_5]|nr:MAG: phosphatidylglycerophosphatase A [Paenibacillus sp. RIFOXYA1_FULL_44_5]
MNVNHGHQLAETAQQWLKDRGVTLEAIGELVLFLQKEYFPDLTLEEAITHVKQVLTKREVQNTILTGIQLDMLAEEGKLLPPLQEIIQQDEGLYGCDEVLSLSIVNVYGSIGYTNFGYIDKIKPGILKFLNDKSTGQIHTFLDDIVGAIAASASSRIAHRRQSIAEGEE